MGVRFTDESKSTAYFIGERVSLKLRYEPEYHGADFTVQVLDADTKSAIQSTNFVFGGGQLAGGVYVMSDELQLVADEGRAYKRATAYQIALLDENANRLPIQNEGDDSLQFYVQPQPCSEEISNTLQYGVNGVCVSNSQECDEEGSDVVGSTETTLIENSPACTAREYSEGRLSCCVRKSGETESQFRDNKETLAASAGVTSLSIATLLGVFGLSSMP